MSKFSRLSLSLAWALCFTDGSPSVAADAKSALQDQPPVAILVIDAFEVTSTEYPVIDEEQDEGNCVVSPDGQDGSAWSGSEAGPYYLTSKLHPGAKPHGRMVYEELEQALSQKGGGQSAAPAATPPPMPDYIRDEATWDFPDGQILVVTVDTDAYRTSEIANRITETIQLLQQERNIQRFVLNMSFAVVPCNKIPELTLEDYEALLGALADDPGFAQLQEDLQGFTSTFGDLSSPTAILAILDELSDAKYLPIRKAAWLARTVPRLKQNLRETYSDELGRIGDCGNLVKAILDDPVLGDPSLVGLFTAFQQPPPDEGGAAPSLDTSVVSADPFFAAAPALQEDEGNQPCFLYDRLPGNSELRQQIDDLRDEFGSSIQVIPIASAGNEGRDFPYAPGYWPGVVSVSADYAELANTQRCPVPSEAAVKELLEQRQAELAAPDESEEMVVTDDMIAEAFAELTTPRFNNGEVMMDGVSTVHIDEVFGCARGTSFSAPRLSVEAALYLLRGGSVACTGDKPSLPPLAHLPWDNLPRVEAGNRFCAPFNRLLAP